MYTNSFALLVVFMIHFESLVSIVSIDVVQLATCCKSILLAQSFGMILT